jgi:hypothetical protein
LGELIKELWKFSLYLAIDLKLCIFLLLYFTPIYKTVFILTVIQGWAQLRLVVNLLLLGCTVRGDDQVKIEPSTGHQHSPGENQTLTAKLHCTPQSAIYLLVIA